MLSTLASVFIGLPILAEAVTLEPRQLIQSNATCDQSFGWASNRAGLSPCYLTAALMGACLQGGFTVGSLGPNYHYDPPQPQNKTVNKCACSWAAYNLFSACTACQDKQESITTWAFYNANCDEFLPATTYWPDGVQITGNSTLPFYAGTNPAEWQDGRFNVAQAKNISDLGRSELRTDRTVQPSALPTSDPDNKPSVGAIVGGVVAGVAVLAAGIFLAWWILRRRRARQGVQELKNRPHMPSFHTRSFSDLTQKTMDPSAGYTSFTTFNQVSSPSPPPVSPTIYTHNESHHSISHFGSVVSAFTTPPQGSTPSRHVTSPAPTTQTVSRENVIQPFTISRSQTPQLGPRKGSEVVLDPYDRMPGVNRADDVDDTVSEISSGRRRRMNPPAYTPNPSPSEASHDVASARRERNGHGHRPYPVPREKGSQDTQTTTSPWTSVGSRGVSDTTVTSTSPPSSFPMGMVQITRSVPGAPLAGEFGQLRSPPATGQRPALNSGRSVLSDQEDDSVEIA